MHCTLPALTISQPYASLIASGEKWVENRSWGTRYRGRIAIHAGKGMQYLTRKQLAEYPTGCLLAIVELAACVSLNSLRRWRVRQADHFFGGYTVSKILDHEHTEGPVCWILGDVRPIDPPIPYSGARGLWECAIDQDLIPALGASHE